MLVAAARPRPRPAAARPRAAARAREGASPPSSSSRGGSRCSSRCSPTTRRCSARTPTVLDRLEGDFRLVDEAHASAAGPAARVAPRRELEGRARRPSRRGRPAEADAARRPRAPRDAARGRRRTSSARSRPCGSRRRTRSPRSTTRSPSTPWSSSTPGSTTIAENLGAIRRARQVVAFGDPVTQTPTLFETGIDDAEPRPDAITEHGVDALHADSALARLGELLPTLTLTRSYRAGGEDLAELVNRRFYAGRIESLPVGGQLPRARQPRPALRRAATGCPTRSPARSRASTPRSRRSSSS